MTRNTARTRTEWQTVLQIYCGLEVVDSMRNHRAPSWYESSLELRRCSVSYCLKPLEPSAVAADKHACVRASSSTSMNPIFEHLSSLFKPKYLSWPVGSRKDLNHFPLAQRRVFS